MTDISTDEQIAELERLKLEAREGNSTWKLTNSPSEDCIYIDPGVATIFPEYAFSHTSEQSLALYIIASHNAFPALLRRLREAEANSVPLGVIRSLDPSLCDYVDGPGALADWLDARDARQRKIGAVQSLREAAGTLGVQKPVGGPREAGWKLCIEIVRDMAERLEKEAGDTV